MSKKRASKDAAEQFFQVVNARVPGAMRHSYDAASQNRDRGFCCANAGAPVLRRTRFARATRCAASGARTHSANGRHGKRNAEQNRSFTID